MATIVRTPRPPRVEVVTLPADVRLMNATANGLFMLAGIGIAVAALMWVARQPAFALKAIRIDGEVTRNSEATIRANAAPKLAGNFFTMDLQAGQRAFETVPWVRHAIVQRIWPNRLAVRLEEHRAAAIWVTGGLPGGAPAGAAEGAGDKLVNLQGEVFEANVGDVEDDELPTLSGPEGSSVQMLEVLRLLTPVYARLERRIDALALSGRGSWRAELDTGARIEMGRGTPEDLLARSERFVGTVAPISGRYQRPIQYADLRHHDGYALKLKGVSTTLTAAEKKSPGRQ